MLDNHVSAPPPPTEVDCPPPPPFTPRPLCAHDDPTVEPRHGESLEEDGDEYGVPHGVLVHQVDDVGASLVTNTTYNTATNVCT